MYSLDDVLHAVAWLETCPGAPWVKTVRIRDVDRSTGWLEASWRDAQGYQTRWLPAGPTNGWQRLRRSPTTRLLPLVAPEQMNRDLRDFSRRHPQFLIVFDFVYPLTSRIPWSMVCRDCFEEPAPIAGKSPFPRTRRYACGCPLGFYDFEE